MKKAGSSRGAAVAQLTSALFGDLSPSLQAPKPLSPVDPLARYQRYLADRDGSYMQIETGTTAPRIKPDWAELSGYDRIALMTMRAIVHNQGAIIPLDVANRGTLPVPRRRGRHRGALPCRCAGAARAGRGAGARPRARPDHAGESVRARHRPRRAHR